MREYALGYEKKLNKSWRIHLNGGREVDDKKNKLKWIWRKNVD